MGGGCGGVVLVVGVGIEVRDALNQRWVLVGLYVVVGRRIGVRGVVWMGGLVGVGSGFGRYL